MNPTALTSSGAPFVVCCSSASAGAQSFYDTAGQPWCYSIDMQENQRGHTLVTHIHGFFRHCLCTVPGTVIKEATLWPLISMGFSTTVFVRYPAPELLPMQNHIFSCVRVWSDIVVLWLFLATPLQVCLQNLIFSQPSCSSESCSVVRGQTVRVGLVLTKLSQNTTCLVSSCVGPFPPGCTSSFVEVAEHGARW